MSERPTPETDALDCELHTPRVLQDRYSEMRDHAQKLEQERDEARESLKQARLLGMSSEREAKFISERDEWAAMCGRYKQERDDALKGNQ